jgi:hypothetical protein
MDVIKGRDTDMDRDTGRTTHKSTYRDEDRDMETEKDKDRDTDTYTYRDTDRDYAVMSISTMSQINPRLLYKRFYCKGYNGKKNMTG